MQKKLVLILGVLCSGYWLVFVSACSTPSYQHSTSGKQVTPYNPERDSILPPITYTLEELGDFNGPSIRLNSSYNYLDKRYLHFIDGKMLEGRKKDKALKKLRKQEIESVEVIPAEEAIELYGQKAKYGAVIIQTK